MRWSILNAIRNIMAAGYDAAEYNRHHKQLSWGRTVAKDEDTLVGKWDRNRLRLECSNLRRNDAIVAGVGERFADNVVGGGISPQAKTSSPEWNSEVEAWWSNWEKVCDSRQRVPMRHVQRLVVQSRLFAGDVGFVMTSGGQIQPIEADRIASPDNLTKEDAARTVEGVKVDRKSGIILGFYVFNRSVNGSVETSSTDYEFVPRENFIFCTRPARFDQVRGIPELTPVINDLRYLHSLQQATLEKANMDAMNAWAIKRNGPNGPGNLGPRGVSSGVDAVQFERFESGRIHYLRPDESVESLSSNTPGSQYLPFTNLSLRIIGSALSLPYEFLLLDFSQGSFSSSRAALLQTYRTFSGWQEWLVSSFLQRLWNWRIAKAIKAGELPPAPIDSKGISEWYKVQWSFPEFGWVDPQSESQAAQLDFNMGATSLSAITRKKGRDAEDVLTEKASDIAVAIRIANDINAQTGSTLTWRDLISTLMPGQNPSASNVQSPTPETAPAPGRTEP